MRYLSKIIYQKLFIIIYLLKVVYQKLFIKNNLLNIIKVVEQLSIMDNKYK